MRRYKLPVVLLLFFLMLGYFLQRDNQIANASVIKSGLIYNVAPKSVPSHPAITRAPATVAKVYPGAPVVKTEANEDVCSFLRKKNLKFGSDLKRETLDSLRTGLSTDDYATLAWLLELEDKPGTKASSQFLTMLGLDDSGMILGRRLPDEVHLENSTSLLEAARSDDPDNGALDIYLASIYQRQGEVSKADEYLERGLKAGRFDLYMPRLMRSLLAAAKSSVDFVKAVELFSIMPIPDLNPIRDFLRSKARDPKLAPAVFNFAQGLVDQAVDSRTPYNHLDWWLSSYVMGANVLQLKGDQPPRAFDLYKEFGQFPDIPNISMDESCDSAELDRSIIDFQNLLRK